MNAEGAEHAMDAADLAIVIARLTGVAEEMGAVLQRAAYSPNIKERADCSAAVFTASGELLVQAEHIPVHLGAMPASVRAAIAMIDARGIVPADGDQIVLNDPFAGGTHLNDVTLVAPVLDGGELIGWVANRAHHADVGGIAPGSMSSEATEIQQEGIRVPPVLLGPDVVEVFVAASRTPAERRGDLAAQAGANRIGVQRVRELALGHDVMREVVDYGERRMRAALRALPDGSEQVHDVLDSTGPGSEPARIACTVTVAGEAITFDFAGTDQQRAGNVNAVEAVTVSSVAFAVRAATDPTIPANGGALRPVRVIAPAGSLVAAVPPVAVAAGNVEVSQRVADVCLRALARFAPERVGAAGQGTMNNVLVGGDGNRASGCLPTASGDAFVYYETIGGGQGGRPGPRPGMSGVHTAMTNTRDTPVEALERTYPMRVRRYTLRRGSGGAGAAPGGDGIVKEYELLVPATVSLVTERRVSAPPGLAGGAAGEPGENWLLPGGDESRAVALGDKITVRGAPGDVFRILTPGGGGYGPSATALSLRDAR